MNLVTIKRFEEIIAWQKARELNYKIYHLTKRDNVKTDFEYVKQMRKAANSIMFNIAEGYERMTVGSFKYFLNIALGSTAEIKTGLYVALDQKYIDENEFKELCEKTNEVSKIIKGFIRYLKELNELKKIKGYP